MVGVQHRRVGDSRVRRHRQCVAGFGRSRRQSPSHRRGGGGECRRRADVHRRRVGGASDRALSDEARWPRNTFERAARRGRSCARPPLPSSGSICSTRPQAPRAGLSYSVGASTRSISCRSPMSRHSSSERLSIRQRVARRLKSAARRICRSTRLRQGCSARRDARRRPGMCLARCCACLPPCSDPSSRIVPVRFVRRSRWTRIDLTFAPTDLHRRFPELPVTSLADILARR